MKILLILDPLKELNVKYDSSLAMIRNLTARGHACYFTDAKELFVDQGRVGTRSHGIRPKNKTLHFHVGSSKVSLLKEFDIVGTYYGWYKSNCISRL